MITSTQKDFDDILRMLAENNIFIIGCGRCAKKQRTGGEPEVLDIEKKLASSGKNVTGWMILKSACNVVSWDDVLSQNPGIGKADAILVMSCGGGVSVISRFANMQVYPGLDTQSIGGICCNEVVTGQCNMCGNCTIWQYGGICPSARCAKGLLNGPCGGAREGKCEVDERDCAWDAIFERLRSIDKLEYLEKIHEPKEYLRKYR